ncbi:hypothetical protein C8R44DRAFT_140105 [Mycena epipterygia]|nr:hypothetical protein C8R44DRAFT_140105 [Mycena epipterygia]
MNAHPARPRASACCCCCRARRPFSFRMRWPFRWKRTKGSSPTRRAMVEYLAPPLATCKTLSTKCPCRPAAAAYRYIQELAHYEYRYSCSGDCPRTSSWCIPSIVPSRRPNCICPHLYSSRIGLPLCSTSTSDLLSDYLEVPSGRSPWGLPWPAGRRRRKSSRFYAPHDHYARSILQYRLSSSPNARLFELLSGGMLQFGTMGYLTTQGFCSPERRPTSCHCKARSGCSLL